MPVAFAGNPMLAERFDGKNMPLGWWISEKYDGVRAMWNGEKLLSRSGHVIHAPQWWLDELPKSTGLDGELYGGPGTFQHVNGVARRKVPNDEDWRHIRLFVFDLLHRDVLNFPFSDRYEVL
jgi:DNA ligase-1